MNDTAWLGWHGHVPMPVDFLVEGALPGIRRRALTPPSPQSTGRGCRRKARACALCMPPKLGNAVHEPHELRDAHLRRRRDLRVPALLGLQAQPSAMATGAQHAKGLGD